MSIKPSVIKKYSFLMRRLCEMICIINNRMHNIVTTTEPLTTIIFAIQKLLDLSILSKMQIANSYT